MNAPSPKAHFQYEDLRHQPDSARAGMWLFLASECLIFGALFLAWIYARHFRPPGYDYEARLPALGLGTVNSVILLSGLRGRCVHGTQ